MQNQENKEDEENEKKKELIELEKFFIEVDDFRIAAKRV